jgi:hypothetical protein
VQYIGYLLLGKPNKLRKHFPEKEKPNSCLQLQFFGLKMAFLPTYHALERVKIAKLHFIFPDKMTVSLCFSIIFASHPA